MGGSFLDGLQRQRTLEMESACFAKHCRNGEGAQICKRGDRLPVSVLVWALPQYSSLDNQARGLYQRPYSFQSGFAVAEALPQFIQALEKSPL
jgi:hypothetical protein